jgi:NIPSNAP protein
VTRGDARLQVIELRSYLLAEGRTRDFIRYFEEHFLFSQRDEGMLVLGQFEVVDEPSRFVWIRGFEDMAARRRGLSRFYGGAFWQAHCDQANAMMREHHDVHLLRPLGSLDALTGGRALEDRAAEPPGAVPSHTGLVVVDVYRTDPGALARLVDVFEGVQPTLVDHGHRILGHFVAELTPNDYPRLPVVQDPAVLVVLSAYRDREQHAALHADGSPPGSDGRRAMQALLTAEVATMALRPTARSVIRHQP